MMGGGIFFGIYDKCCKLIQENVVDKFSWKFVEIIDTKFYNNLWFEDVRNVLIVDFLFQLAFKIFNSIARCKFANMDTQTQIR